MSNAKERNIGIELLRIIAMVAIMVLHVLGRGGVLNVAPALSKNYEAAWAMEILCYTAVTAYALISGYAGLVGSFHFTNIVYLWLQVFFYSFVYTIGFLIFMPGAVTINVLLCDFFPIMTECYWYFSAYAAMFIFIPAIKHVINNAPKVYLNGIMGFIVIFFSVLYTFFSNIDVFGLKYAGASFLWITSCFYIGAYIKKFNVLAKIKTSGLWLMFFGGVGLTFLSKLAIELVYGADKWDIDRGNLLVSYNSPTLLVSSISLLLIFSRIKVEGSLFKKVITIVAPLTFGVYLSNAHPLVWVYIMKGAFSAYSTYPVWKLIICTLLSAIVLFLIGIAMDAVRNLIFELGHLRGKLRAVEKYILDKAS